MDIEAVRKAFSACSDAAVITSEVNRRYITRFYSTDGYVIVTEDKTYLFVDSRYIEAAQRQACCDEVILFNGIEETLKPFLQEKGIKTLSAESDRLTVSTLQMLRDRLKTEVISDGTLDKAIDKARAVKTEQEVEYIRSAQQIAESAFDYILGFIEGGRTEKEISLALDFYMLSHGADAISFETIVVSGANSSMPHGVPTNKAVHRGDFITMDYGAVVNGYHSDMTRTVAVGFVSDEQKEIYDIVLNAQETAFSALKAGEKCRNVDAAARNVINQRGFGKCFGHSLGHGVGAEIHEKPNLSPKSEAILEMGNIVTNEPGIYIPGKFGVRIEDMALVTENGYENLTSCEKKPIIL